MASQIIPKERLAAYHRWEMGAFEQAGNAPGGESCVEGDEEEAATAAILPTVEQIERIHQEAHQEGHAAGYEAGYASGYEVGRTAGYTAGQERGAAEAARLQDLLGSFQQALADADQAIGNDLLTLALDLARQMVREALRVKPELVLAVVRESIRCESTFGQPPQLTLHPDDAALVREHLNHELDGCTIRIDPDLERGGCRVQAGASQTDATLATRWRRIGQALGRNSRWLDDSESVVDPLSSGAFSG
ncbi:MAG: flagellar assembly protein FliH [Nitrosospira sp.]|nr:flagellar assembly protein FliH [Nitrosospira sp.]